MMAKLIKMRGKLIKESFGYVLEVRKNDVLPSAKVVGQAGRDPYWVIIASTDTSDNYLNLSLKNCQDIELGYNLEELAADCASENKSKFNNWYGVYVGFQLGFHKALKILGENRFTEEEVSKIWKAGQEYWKTSGSSITFEEIVEKRSTHLKPTEWDVEVVVEECDVSKVDNLYVSTIAMTQEEAKYLYDNRKPKLDANGCLVLIRL